MMTHLKKKKVRLFNQKKRYVSWRLVLAALTIILHKKPAQNSVPGDSGSLLLASTDMWTH